MADAGAAGPAAPVDPHGGPPADAEFQEHGRQRRLGGAALVFVGVVALLFSAYQLSIAAFSPLSSLITRSIHVGFLLLLIFVLYPMVARGRQLTRVPLLDWGLAILGFALGLYQWVFEAALIQRSGDPTTTDLVVGTIVVVLVFEAARRVLGVALPIVCSIFLLYGLFGQYLPGELGAPALRLRADRRPARLRHRGHLRHPDAGLGDLHLPSSSCSAPSSSTPA